jgi:hypothetical protein
MGSESVFYGRTKAPLTFSDVRRLTIRVRDAIVLAIRTSDHPEYILPTTTASSTLVISIAFKLGDYRSLTILPHDDHSVSISMGAWGCAPDVMQAIRPVLLSIGIDWLALSYRADDAGDDFEMLAGSAEDFEGDDDE